MNCPKLRTDTAVLLICAATLLLGIWGILAIVTSQAEHTEPLRLAGRQTVFLLTGFALLEMIRRIPFDFFRRRKFILEIAALCSLWALPIAGERNCYTGELTNDAQCGYYWSYTSDGWAERRYLCFDESGRTMTPVPGYHSWGFSVRCVREK